MLMTFFMLTSSFTLMVSFLVRDPDTFADERNTLKVGIYPIAPETMPVSWLREYRYTFYDF